MERCGGYVGEIWSVGGGGYMSMGRGQKPATNTGLLGLTESLSSYRAGRCVGSLLGCLIVRYNATVKHRLVLLFEVPLRISSPPTLTTGYTLLPAECSAATAAAAMM